MSNDGTKEFDHANDGLMQQLGGCMRDFRNKPYAVRAKIEYYKNSLTVRVDFFVLFSKYFLSSVIDCECFKRRLT